jgi:hypothetical protein
MSTTKLANEIVDFDGSPHCWTHPQQEESCGSEIHNMFLKRPTINIHINHHQLPHLFGNELSNFPSKKLPICYHWANPQINNCFQKMQLFNPNLSGFQFT